MHLNEDKNNEVMADNNLHDKSEANEVFSNDLNIQILNIIDQNKIYSVPYKERKKV